MAWAWPSHDRVGHCDHRHAAGTRPMTVTVAAAVRVTVTLWSQRLPWPSWLSHSSSPTRAESESRPQAKRRQPHGLPRPSGRVSGALPTLRPVSDRRPGAGKRHAAAEVPSVRPSVSALRLQKHRRVRFKLTLDCGCGRRSVSSAGLADAETSGLGV